MKQKRNFTAIAFATLMLLAGGGVAQAGTYTVVGGEGTNDKSIAIGSNSKAGNTDARASVAIGDSADATGSGGVAIGKDAKARQSQGIAIGDGADALQTSGIAIGVSSKAHMNALAFGVSASAQSEGAIAFGFGAITGLSNSGESIAFGYQAKTSAVKSIAFGSGAHAQERGAVALGSGSFADRPSGVAGYNRLNQNFGNAPIWTASQGAVSIGDGIPGNSDEETRQIIHVAAGSKDTDAVNVAQLKASQTKLELESNLLTKTESKTADGITYTLGIDASKLPKTDIVAGKGVSVSKTDPMKPIVLLNDDQDFSGTVTASEFKVGSSASLDTTGLNLIGTSTVTLKDSNPSLEKKTVLSTEGISVSRTTSHLGTHLTADGLYILTNVSDVSLTKTGLVLGTGNPSVTTSGIKAGNKKITGLADGADDGDAVNVKQLKKSKTELQLASDETNLALENPVQEDDNGKHYVLRLNRDVNFDKVTTGNLVIGETGSLVFGTAGARLTNTGLELGGLNGPKFTTNGISAGGQQIKNVRAGTEGTDAVNVQQMEAHVKANTSKVVAGNAGIKVDATPDAENGTTYTVSLNEEHTFTKLATETVKANKVQIGDAGPSMDADGVHLAGKKITNVGRAEADTDAVNLGQMNEEIKRNKSSVAAGRGISVATSDDVGNGGKRYTVSLNENIEFTEVKTGDTTISSNGVSIAGGPSMTKDNGINAGNKVITNVADGVNATDAVNVSQLNSRLNQSKVTVKAKENGNITVEQSAQTDNGTEYTVSLNDSVSVNEVHVAQNVHLSSEGVRIGNSGPIIAESGIDAANRTISNVAPGVRATDAVNVAQLNTAVNNVFRQVHSVEKDAQAGIAMAIATAGLPQAYLPGKSMMAISGGTYRGQSGYAFGFSHVTDNGRYVIKASGSGNSQGHFGASVGMGWQW